MFQVLQTRPACDSPLTHCRVPHPTPMAGSHTWAGFLSLATVIQKLVLWRLLNARPVPAAGHPTVDRDGETRRAKEGTKNVCLALGWIEEEKETAISRAVSGRGEGSLSHQGWQLMQTPALLEATRCQSDSGRTGSACPSESCVLLHLWTGDEWPVTVQVQLLGGKCL